MKRDIYRILRQWKQDKKRRPLLMRGARQVGKSYIVDLFGHREFGSLVTLNFEKNPEYKDIFSSYDPQEIVERISLLTGERIVQGKTLLFLDEIQDCPSAITALRYFYEEMPMLHVIGAGSLLEFALESEDLRMPVGRVQYLYLFPLSFGEFLEALDKEHLRKHLLEDEAMPTMPDSLHDQLNELVRKYFLIGGMPAVVAEYCATRDIIQCQRIQRSILDNYLDDFSKYAKEARHRFLQKVFNAVPTMVGQKFVYAHVDNAIRSRELKAALELLEMASVVRRVKSTSGAGVPLEAGAQDNHFKVLFMDVGLLHSVNGIYAETVQAEDFTTLFRGAVAEQFVGQELLAYQSPYSRPSLYYWVRAAKNSNAELDYLLQRGTTITPIEVKSGSVGKMKSMRIFMDAYHVPTGVKISQARYSKGEPILSLPLYAIESLFCNS